MGKHIIINSFVNPMLVGESLTVYNSVTQARNSIHLIDIAQAYVRSAERLLEQPMSDVASSETYEIVSSEDIIVLVVAEIVSEAAKDKLGTAVDIEPVENPWKTGTMIHEFSANILKIT